MQFLADESEKDRTSKETSQRVPVVLYGRPLFASESGTEGGDETSFDEQAPGPSKGSGSRMQPEETKSRTSQVEVGSS